MKAMIPGKFAGLLQLAQAARVVGALALSTVPAAMTMLSGKVNWHGRLQTRPAVQPEAP